MSEDHAYYQLKELIRDEMLEQSPDLAKIMTKYKALTAAKDAEITALQMQIRIEGAVNANEIAALKAEIKRLRVLASRILGKNQIYEGFILVSPDTLGEFLSPGDTSEDDTDEPHSFDPEFCPNCKTTEWYHGDRINHYGCHNCGVDFVHIDSPADGDGVEETKDENGLLPCPFCGEKADFLTFEQQSFKGFEIRCSNQSCNAYKQTAPLNYWPMAQLDRQKAKWNSRAGRGIEG